VSYIIHIGEKGRATLSGSGVDDFLKDNDMDVLDVTSPEGNHLAVNVNGATGYLHAANQATREYFSRHVDGTLDLYGSPVPKPAPEESWRGVLSDLHAAAFSSNRPQRARPTPLDQLAAMVRTG